VSRGRGQSLVEFGLVAPILLLLAIAVWDGGSVLREQVILEQAARDGARVAASDYGEVPLDVVAEAVRLSAADLPGVTPTVEYRAGEVEVRLTYDHALYTPVLRNLWGGSSGAVRLTASAVFFVPQLTPVPGTIVPSTPIPTATPTSTPTSTPVPPTATPTRTPTVVVGAPTATRTPTPTATRTPTPTWTPTVTPSPTATPQVRVCWVSFTVPFLDNNRGWYYTFTTDTTTPIWANWSHVGRNGNDQLSIRAGAPPGTVIASDSASANGDTSIDAVTTQWVPAGTYTLYFFNRGVREGPSSGWVSFFGRTCPA
jgi:hypothetical protein